VRRAALDGSHAGIMQSMEWGANGIALDVGHAKMYWGRTVRGGAQDPGFIKMTDLNSSTSPMNFASQTVPREGLPSLRWDDRTPLVGPNTRAHERAGWWALVMARDDDYVNAEGGSPRRTRPISAVPRAARSIHAVGNRAAYAFSTANGCHRPGTPFNSCSPRSANSIPEPATRSVTVRDTSVSPGAACADTRCPM
jgi:hypothetical protein